ncbi:MAG: pyridoxal 5'-phosphate synthase glutaminase subunit PdxT [Cyanobacteria bacterium SZAS LIN-3]|nr:pyridoxal 5'-phosphate synthase glutaminase subunit PdxT [Cyanobacteria bacterium SZAS LIN-3]
MRIGVLALQGDFAEHIHALERADQDVTALAVRYAEQLVGEQAVDALVIPGGESTAIAKLVDDGSDPIFDAIRSRGLAGMPIYGTCMGSIFLAREIEGSTQGRLALMDITVRRNAFGPQRKSFESEIEVAEFGAEPLPAVFIRAPIILKCGPQVKVMATLAEGIVMARQDNLLVTAFHPEIVDDNRVHRYFIDMVRESLKRDGRTNPAPETAQRPCDLARSAS